MIRSVYKYILKECSFLQLSQIELKNIIVDKLDDKFFLTKQEKEVEISVIFNYLLRYIDYEKTKDRNIINKNLYGTVILKGEDKEVEVNADIVFENEDSIELVKFKTGATTLSYKARTEKNLPKNDIELFMMKKLGEKLYSKYDKPIIASFYHLKGKSEDKDIYKQFLENKSNLINQIEYLNQIPCLDKKEKKAIDKQIKTIEDVLYFNNSDGNNIISYGYNEDLFEEINNLVNIELNSSSEKCNSTDCDFCNYATLCKHKDTSKDIELSEVHEVKKSDGEIKLTDNQKQIVDIEKGAYRINAGAGSGKSTVLVMRVIELLKKGHKPEDILMITFTNKGCGELKEKIAYWLKYYKMKGINPYDLEIYTFNGFGSHIIEREWEQLGFTKPPQIANMIDINDIIKELLQENNEVDWLNYKNPLINFPNTKGAFKQLLVYFNLIKSFNYNEKSLSKDIIIKEKNIKNEIQSDLKSREIFNMYNKFNKKLKEKNLMQYQDQVLHTIELFNKYPQVLKKYGYKHIIIDEYQDTNFTQVELLKILNKDKETLSLMAVGDSSQAIYGFTNTTPLNLINFNKEFKEVKDIFLLDNFRSTPQICAVANSLDRLNTIRIDKEITGRKKNGTIPALIEYPTLESENESITDVINTNIKDGIPKNEICYIARTKKELLVLKKALDKNNIPSIIEASELYLDNSYIQCIINLSNFFRNREHEYYLMEYMSILDKEFINKPSEDIKSEILSLKEKTIKDLEGLEDEESKITYFYDLISPVEKLDKVSNIFIEDLKKMTFHTFYQLLDYLYKLRLYEDGTSIVKDDKKYDAICLTTAHSSKGKEWSVVINSINKYKYKDIKQDLGLLEEERRLLFVSITRAKELLYITYNTNQDKSRNKGEYCLFVDELENVENYNCLE